MTQTPDTTGDGKVDALDLNELAANWQQQSSQGDANGDGVVNSLDLNIIAAHWGEVASAQWSRQFPDPLSGAFRPGIIAKHPNGIKRVIFRVTSSATIYVYPTSPTQNRIVMASWRNPVAWNPLAAGPRMPEQDPSQAQSVLQLDVSNVNPDTGDVEFWIVLNAKDSPDDRMVLQATVEPNSSDPIDLPPLYFVTNYWPTNGSGNA